ncbi:MAG TPA: ABC transporter permease [Solirubrobacterales bacterium]
MTRFVLKRLAGMALVLFAVSVIVFLIFNVIPNSDPAQRMAGKNATPQLVEAITEEWGFDEPLPVQYAKTMKLIFTGGLVSYSDGTDVDERILEGIPATLSLAIGAAVIWVVLGIAFGYLAAVRAGRFTDRALTVLATIGISMPVFWLGAVLLYFLTYEVELFPNGGYVPLTEDPLDWAYHLVLPWVTVAALYVGLYSRALRANMLDAMHADHVEAARAKGLPEGQVMRRHVLRNSLIPTVTLFGLDFGAAVGGSALLTETIFSLHGVGQYAIESTLGLDLPPIMGVTLYAAFFVVLFNALVDIAYAYLDPRVRLGSSAP